MTRNCKSVPLVVVNCTKCVKNHKLFLKHLVVSLYKEFKIMPFLFSKANLTKMTYIYSNFTET